MSELDEPELLSGEELESILAPPSAALTYLTSVDSQIRDGGIVSQLAIYTVAAALLTNIHTKVQLAALNTMRLLVESQPSQVHAKSSAEFYFRCIYYLHYRH